AVLVHHQHRRERPRAGGLHEIAAHRGGVAAGGWIGDVVALDARIGERDGLCARVIGQEREREGERAERTCALQEFAPVNATVAILVVKVEDLLVDLLLRDGVHRFLSCLSNLARTRSRSSSDAFTTGGKSLSIS